MPEILFSLDQFKDPIRIGVIVKHYNLGKWDDVNPIDVLDILLKESGLKRTDKIKDMVDSVYNKIKLLEEWDEL